VESYPAPAKAGQVPGTMSETVDFQDGRGRTVVTVHRYVTPSGAVGASGLLDPLALLHEGRIYRAKGGG